MINLAKQNQFLRFRIRQINKRTRPRNRNTSSILLRRGEQMDREPNRNRPNPNRILEPRFGSRFSNIAKFGSRFGSVQNRGYQFRNRRTAQSSYVASNAYAISKFHMVDVTKQPKISINVTA